ncbi:MAG: ABC transporter permease [Actinomycetota bacterium]|nr:ABC transporter permease [Actinomycetota bacterium]
MSDFFTASVLIATVASGIRLATPYLLAALGETIGQRSGMLNLGVDGIMLLGAFGAYYTVLETESLVLGVAVGALVGLGMGVIVAFVNVTLRSEQGISGIGVYLFGLGFSDLLFQTWVGTPRSIRRFGSWDVPLLSDIPWVGEMFFQHSPAVYAAFALVPIVAFVLRRTDWGLRVKAVGEDPAAADSVGVRVQGIRWSTTLIGSMFAGLAGAALAIELGIFQQNLTNGQGFIAIALVYFGAWRPLGVMGGALLYGLVAATVLQWRTLGIIPQSASDLAAMTPAVITVVALVFVASRQRGPAALTKAFERGG